MSFNNIKNTGKALTGIVASAAQTGEHAVGTVEKVTGTAEEAVGAAEKIVGTASAAIGTTSGLIGKLEANAEAMKRKAQGKSKYARAIGEQLGQKNSQGLKPTHGHKKSKIKEN